MPASLLEIEAAKLRSWLCEKALPFWAENGVDDQGGWYEHLTLNGSPNTDAIRRVRVQARQIYVYALADKMEWYPGEKIVSRTFGFMVNHGFEQGGEPGFVHLITPDYKVHDSKRDLYDHAFFLLACLWSRSIVGSSKAKAVSDKILGLLKKWESPYGGWREGTPAKLPRRQNPHMHLLEAFMAGYDLTGETHWLDKASQIYALFEQRFFDSKHHIIQEFFKEDWRIADGEMGETSEPGHLAEWIWLLWMFEKRAGVDTSNYANALYENLTQKPGPFLNDEEDVRGQTRRSTKRLWVQTEVIKAHIAQANRGVVGAADTAAKLIQDFTKTYLKDDGTWVDQIDNAGNPTASTIPTSTFYHIICMIFEASECKG